MAKKILIISAAVFVVALCTLIVYKVFLSGQEDNLDIGIDDIIKRDDDGDGRDQDEGTLTKIVDGTVMGATATNRSSHVQYYKNQKILRATFEGEVRSSLGAYPFVKVKEFKWHPNNEKAIVNDNGKYHIYSLDDNTALEFIRQIDMAVWDAHGDRIIYKRYDPESKKRSIEISKDYGEEPETLVGSIPYKKVDFAVSPEGDDICYFRMPDSTVEGVLKCVDRKSKEQKEIDKGRFGTDYLWSPDGKKILLSFAKQKKGDRLSLGVINSNGGEFKGLSIATTVKKCVWDNDSEHVYCGAMNALPKNIVLPNEWESGKHSSSDTFWKINTKNGKQTRLVDLEQTPGHLDGENYFLDKNGKNLFFTDRKTGSLYRIKL